MHQLLDLVTPGEVLEEEFMKPLNISQNRLARDIDVPPSRIHAIVHGRRSIIADMALRDSVSIFKPRLKCGLTYNRIMI